jgi:hypothetical protein
MHSAHAHVNVMLLQKVLRSIKSMGTRFLANMEPWTKTHTFALFLFDCPNTLCCDNVLVPASGSVMPRKFTNIQWIVRAIDTVGNGERYFRRGKVTIFKGSKGKSRVAKCASDLQCIDRPSLHACQHFAAAEGFSVPAHGHGTLEVGPIKLTCGCVSGQFKLNL